MLSVLLAVLSLFGGSQIDGEVPDPLAGLHEALAAQEAENLYIWNAAVGENMREAKEHLDYVAEQERIAAAEAEALVEASVVETPTATEAAPVASYGSGACGGSLPPCSVMMCESGGDITAQNPSSSASGKWQVIDSTWNGYGGYPTAASAPESVQDAFAAELYAGGAGAGHWVCS